ncbi:MAG TPA: hypothetical protein VFZ25_09345 [Chloroflexota bacterium]|nr:hypothetical protein [Chloroflexota bacterium]
MPVTVGDCRQDEQHNPVNGDGLQATTGVGGAGGLLVWRKADNWTAFTDGFHSWVNGPCGLAQRLNSQRFPWEGDAAGFPLIQDGCSAPAPTGPPPQPTPTATAVPLPGMVQVQGIAFFDQPGAILCGRDYSKVNWTTLSFRVIAGDASSHDCSPTVKDAPGIKSVKFDFIPAGATDAIYSNLEHNAAYCAFPSDDPTCPPWVFAQHGNKWPNGKAVQSGTYRLEITVDMGTNPDVPMTPPLDPFTIKLP